MMQPHIEADCTINDAQLRKCIQECNGTAAILSRIFNLCKSHQQDDNTGQDRVRQALKQDLAMAPPYTYGLRKDHKNTTEPPLRPVCGASTAPNNIVSHMLAQVLKRVAEEVEGDRSVSSTEEMIAIISKVNKGIRDTNIERRQEVCVGSMDVKALYPSITKEWVVKILKLQLMNTPVNFKNINWNEAALYIAVSYTPDEIDAEGLKDVIHKRRYSRGQKPGLTSNRILSGPKPDQSEESNWINPNRSPTQNEKKKILTLTIIAGVLNCMNNHTYRFNRVNKKQSDGGSIGNILTGEIAKLVMSWWSKEFTALAQQATSHIMEKFIIEAGIYVDDMNIIFHPLPPGARWCEEERKMIIMQDRIEDNGESKDKLTMNEMRKMANTICPIIQMEEDFPSKNKDSKLPILDLKVWVRDDNIIMHEFYRKSMSSRTMMMKRSAMPKTMKRSVLTQEGIRILRNCSEDIPWQRVEAHLTEFSLRMKLSGYNENYRQNIIKSSLAGWRKQKEQENNGTRPLYREKAWHRIERRKEKERKTAHWYRNDKNDKHDFPIFCPCTPKSELLHKWRKVADEVRRQSNDSIRPKIIEQGGTALKSIICKSSPKENHCTDPECYICECDDSGSLNCRKTSVGGIGYEIQCVECNENGKKSLYHGETSRTLYTRVKEHLRQGRDATNETKPLLKHSMLHHSGRRVKFSIRKTGSFKDSLSRQINEGVRINNTTSDPGYLMNSKSEFHQGEVPRVVIMNGFN